ncbi:DUF2931 family protein, partial [Fulvimonas sp. R45]|uniref:DUF2931 family protein n=1 Tax=Fulvimonas sp. R45 TaxID=3045937 RepID=UPI00265D6CA3
MKQSLLWLFGLMLALTACASETHLPYRAWHLSFSSIAHMYVWVEDAQVVDVAGKHFHGLGVGSLQNNSDTSPAGWASSSGRGPGFDVLGAALPAQIYVRWQSLVEPQTYQAIVVIPDSVRKMMLTQGPNKPEFKHPVPGAYYYNRINVGLAPGGCEPAPPERRPGSDTLIAPWRFPCNALPVVATQT